MCYKMFTNILKKFIYMLKKCVKLKSSINNVPKKFMIALKNVHLSVKKFTYKLKKVH